MSRYDDNPREPHTSAGSASFRAIPTPEPSRISEIELPTHDLVATYRRACDRACYDGLARAPESSNELTSIDVLKSTFTKSLTYALGQLVDTERFDRSQVENTVGPWRIFMHSERVLYKEGHLPAEISFIAEMNNRNHDWVNFSPFGWVRHSNGPVFTQVTALLSDPLLFRCDLLYSKAAFAEELTAIGHQPMQYVLGIAGRSFMIERAFRHIAANVRPRPLYHSSVTALRIRKDSDSSAELTAVLRDVGQCTVNLTRDSKTARLSLSA